MSSFPNFSNISDYVQTTLNSRKKDQLSISGLTAWVRVASGVGNGCVLLSNPNFSIFKAAGDKTLPSIYGNSANSGVIGVTWDGTAIYASGEAQPLKPKPNITSIEIDEGSGNISRKASFSIKVYTEAQLNEITKYFLEPGFTIYIEWGWNQKASLATYQSTLSESYITDTQNFAKINERRSKSGGLYDCYLGFITGGSIGMDGDGWVVNISCTGFTELPAYFMAADNIEKKGEKIETAAKKYPTYKVLSEQDLGKKRFMQMYNKLSSNRQTQLVKDLISNVDSRKIPMASPVNFINFDEAVKNAINNKTDGAFFGLIKNDSQVSEGGKSVSFPTGTKIIGDDAFIRFGALIKIMNSIGIDGYKIGNEFVTMTIDSSTTIISAFPEIFSADKSKLFIPNKNTPKFDLEQAATNAEPQNTYSGTFPNNVKYGEIDIQFPSPNAVSNGTADGIKIDFTNTTIKGSTIPAEKWGWLDDLYVNFDFAKGILETKNFVIKDALYQILNGLSSAAGGLWDFQIIQVPSPSAEVTANNSATKVGVSNYMLKIVDLNLVSNTTFDNIATFDVYGLNSIFTEASFDMDISGEQMNRIIGSRLGGDVNSSRPSYEGKLFATGLTDKILKDIQLQSKEPSSDEDAGGEVKSEDDEVQKNLELFLQKVGIFPKINLEGTSDFSLALEELIYIGCLNDLMVFDAKKVGNDTTTDAAAVSVLLPIKFTFTVHGVSGIKRGDKFKVRGIPRKYADNGFFQVLSVKHTIDDMTWKTQIEGGFRQQQQKKA
jgi:hypothetical protein